MLVEFIGANCSWESPSLDPGIEFSRGDLVDRRFKLTAAMRRNLTLRAVAGPGGKKVWDTIPDVVDSLIAPPHMADARRILVVFTRPDIKHVCPEPGQDKSAFHGTTLTARPQDSTKSAIYEWQGRTKEVTERFVHD